MKVTLDKQGLVFLGLLHELSVSGFLPLKSFDDGARK